MNDEPATPLAVVGLVTAGAGGLITRVTFWVAFGAVPLAAWTVKANEPAVVGVPLTIPLVAFSVRPGGNVPVAMDQVMGVVPVAVNVRLYAVPTVPFGGAVLVIVGATVAVAMTMVTLWVALGSVPLAACTVNVNEPAVVGVPLRMPLVPLRARLVGNVPVAMLHVIGVVPVAVKVWL